VTGDRTRWIQRNAAEALREVAQDIEEGADIIMVKPAVTYLGRDRAREGGVRLSDGGVTK